MMNPDKIIQEILEQFKRLEHEDVSGWSPQARWTSEILTALCKTGRDTFGYSVYASSRFVDKDHRTGKEWVYDLTWYEPDDSDRLKSIPLVAECEWKHLAEIIDDFQKILLARATVRVMVFDGKHSDDRARGVVDKLCSWIEAFEGGQKGDTYLLIGYEEDGKDWWFRYFKVIAEDTGQKPVVEEL